MNKFSLSDLQSAFRLPLGQHVAARQKVPRHLRSKYQPHQNEREKARRVRQMQRADKAGGSPNAR